MSQIKTVKVIAEVGCNHMGDFELAKEYIKTAATFCKVDIVKFQKRNIKELLSKATYDAPHPNPINSYGETYGKHREFLEFDLDQHTELKKYCEQLGVQYSTSVWDVTSAKEMASLSPKMLKVPSACNNNKELILWLCENYEGDIHVSLGMTTRHEENQLIDLFKSRNRNKDLTLYSCTSGYPVDFSDVCLKEITRLKQTFGSVVKDIGFSGHHKGIAIDIAAVTLGASFVERHFTLDRTSKGTDHAASLEPEGLRKLKRGIIATEKAMTFKKEEILEIEKVQREKLKMY